MKKSLKKINLKSLLHAEALSSSCYESFLSHHGIKIKKHESGDLEQLVVTMMDDDASMEIFNGFYFGFEIKQISKEFDLLRIGTESVVNIELKHTSDLTRIRKQLIENKYYLKFLGVEIRSFTFVSTTKELYTLNESNEIEEVGMIELLDVLGTQNLREINSLEELFTPTQYLVSPFNSTKKFLAGDYFLTAQQQTFKRNVLTLFSSSEAEFVSLSGVAGTGKTLLLYDIAKHYISEGEEILLIHCGKLNNGHSKLSSAGWDITAIKYLSSKNLSRYSLIFVDETQRIYPEQLDKIINISREHGIKCIFSHDYQQCLHTKEVENDISNKILRDVAPLELRLTETIRTNKEIINFVKCLFDKDEPIHDINFKNVHLNFFNDTRSAVDFVESMERVGWSVLNLTPSTRTVLPYDSYHIDEALNSHEAIGQEFDDVIVIIDSHFYYNGNVLSTQGYRNNPYYHPTKMLFQNLTRARVRLNIVVIDNQIITERILNILKHS